jgi:hypothetical protein
LRSKQHARAERLGGHARAIRQDRRGLQIHDAAAGIQPFQKIGERAAQPAAQLQKLSLRPHRYPGQQMLNQALTDQGKDLFLVEARPFLLVGHHPCRFRVLSHGRRC